MHVPVAEHQPAKHNTRRTFVSTSGAKHGTARTDANAPHPLVSVQLEQSTFWSHSTPHAPQSQFPLLELHTPLLEPLLVPDTQLLSHHPVRRTA